VKPAPAFHEFSTARKSEFQFIFLLMFQRLRDPAMNAIPYLRRA
jgi:hypothetical protein